MDSRRAILGFVALCSCGGQSVGPAVDASFEADASSADGGADAPGDRCPTTKPANGYDCSLGNALGLACPYGATTCTCNNVGQNTAQWACVSPDAGGDASADAGPLDCAYDDGGAQLDPSSRFKGSCSAGCPAGTICAVEIGG